MVLSRRPSCIGTGWCLQNAAGKGTGVEAKDLDSGGSALNAIRLSTLGVFPALQDAGFAVLMALAAFSI